MLPCMIRMIQSTSGEQAKSYFVGALSKADYYLDDQELNGQFRGALAERLGVHGMANKETFFALCENSHPKSGKPLTKRTKEERTVGYDINFHCPKSVSILHALSKDDHLLKAFERSVHETMQDIEADAMTRVRKGGQYTDRKTGELLYADFIHQTARPVDGCSPDPHLHAHCFVFNVTWDNEEKAFKAGQFRDIKRDMPYYQARFHKRLSDHLMALGYQVKRTDKSFEVAGVPTQVIDLFSKRTDEIGRVAKEKGITGTKELAELGARTRSKKQKGSTMSDLKTEWRKQIAELELESGEGEQPIRFSPDITKAKVSPRDCIEYALKHSFERASVMPERRIMETCYRYGIGDSSTNLEAISDAFKNDQSIIHVKERNRIFCTTKAVLMEEKHMVELARKGQGQMRPLYSQAPKLEASGQQAAAIEHVLTTTHLVSIIRGAAGAGKTTLMKEAVEHIKRSGKHVTIIAPTAQASRGVLRDEGFREAETVAKFLHDRDAQESIRNQVLWVDEAGLLGTSDMKELLSIATQKNARLILGGDTRQHASVVRGDALRILNTVAGIRSAEVTKIYRQRTQDYREAVQKLSEGNVLAAFERLDDIGSIKAVDPLKPNEVLLEDYMDAVQAGKSTLIISPTHQQGKEVTQALRSKLRGSGKIGKKELAVTRLSNLNFTTAQKSDGRSFHPGQLLQFNQNSTGIKRGSLWIVDTSPDGQIRIKNRDGDTKELPLDRAKDFDVFEKSEIGLSKGDKVSITRNGFDQDEKRLNNGQSLEVVSVSKKGDITLTNPTSKAIYKLNKEFGHVAHAYCVTSHTSQGKTVDEVFISQPSGTFSATNAKQFYVSVSRGRDKAHIYTDDKVGLLEHASEIGNRQSAIELVSRFDKHTDHVIRFEQEKFVTPEIEKAPMHIITPFWDKDRNHEPGL